MKTIFPLLLSLLSLIPAFGQKAYELPGIFFSSHLGVFPDEDFHASVVASLGYQHSDWVGLGLHIGSYTEFDSYPESFSGGGVYNIALLPANIGWQVPASDLPGIIRFPMIVAANLGIFQTGILFLI